MCVGQAQAAALADIPKHQQRVAAATQQAQQAQQAQQRQRQQAQRAATRSSLVQQAPLVAPSVSQVGLCT